MIAIYIYINTTCTITFKTFTTHYIYWTNGTQYDANFFSVVTGIVTGWIMPCVEKKLFIYLSSSKWVLKNIHHITIDIFLPEQLLRIFISIFKTMFISNWLVFRKWLVIVIIRYISHSLYRMYKYQYIVLNFFTMCIHNDMQ